MSKLVNALVVVTAVAATAFVVAVRNTTLPEATQLDANLAFVAGLIALGSIAAYHASERAMAKVIAKR